jgi:hypothetical protein
VKVTQSELATGFVLSKTLDSEDIKRVGRSGKLLMASPAQAIWFKVSLGPITIIVVLSKTLRVLKWGLRFDERKGLTTTGHSPSIGVGGDSCGRALTH